MTVDRERIDAAGRPAPAEAGGAAGTAGTGAPGRVHEAIEAQARRTPERVAVVAGTDRLGYAELDRRADDVARTLAGRGIGRGDLVGVCLERDAWLVPALVGVWKSGAAYVPLDPAYPAERLRFMAEDAAVAAVVTSAALRRTAALTGAEAVLVDDVEPGGGAFRVAGDPGDPGDAAYVIYTSGSTGTPKGVVVEHRNTMNLLNWEASAYTAEELRGMLAGASVCFDASITQLFLPLITGGTVILADNVLALPTLPAREEVTTVYGVPSALAVLLREPLPSGVRAVFSGGERLTGALVRRIYANPGVRRVLNLYGPTECTTSCTVAEVGRDHEGDPPLGAPMAGAVLSVRDADGNPVPDGELGELWIGGPGVTRGYLGRESPAFRTGPDGARVYRSGDLVRRVDGALHYAGRADDQVKIRGYRVEPGEVEAVLGRHPAVRRAVVLAAADDDGTAYLAGHVAASGVGEPELRDWLRARLPDHLVPTRIGVAEELPLAPNGKVDRAALPALGAARPAGAAPVAPRTEDERLVAEVVAGVLGLPRVGVHDRFTDLGGHSLAAARVVTELSRRLGRTVPLADFLAAPTAAGLAAALDRAGPEAVRRSGRTRYPLTGMQRQFWTLSRLHPHSPVTTLAIRLRVRGLREAAPLRAALDAVVRRHEVLRSTIAVDADGVPYAVVRPLVAVPLVEHPVGEDPEKVARTAAAHVFDLTGEVPLLRAELCWLGAAEAELVVVVDHLAFDGGSVAVLMGELAAELAGEPVPGPAVQFGDVAVQEQERPDPVRLREFWREELAGAPVADPAPADLTAGRVIRPLSGEFEAGVDALARECGVTPFAVYLAGLALAGGEPDTLVGVVAARRARPELTGVIGPLVDTLPVRVRPAGAPTFRDLVRQAADAATRALVHQEVPVEDLPRAPVLLAVQHAEVPVRLGGLELLTDLGSGATGHELAVLVNRTADGAELQLEYALARLDPVRAEAYLDRLMWLLRCAPADPDRPLSAFELVTPDERAALLATAAGPAVPEFPETVPHALAAHTGGTAVVGPDGASIGYPELHEWSGRVAAALLEYGVAPGEVVGVCLPRDHLMPAALLAVWRAGAAYLPLDPEHPAERLRLLAEDAGARVVLTRGGAAAAVPGVKVRDAAAVPGLSVPDAAAVPGVSVPDAAAVPGVSVPDAAAAPGLIVLDADDLAARGGSAELPEVRAGDLAYVLYTSGSTGTPKGVEVTHGNLAAYVAGLTSELGLGPGDVQPVVAPLTFDTSASELWSMLSVGGTCVVVDRATAVDGHALAGRIAECGATVVDLVPTAYRMLLAAGWAGDPGLLAIAGGETLDPALAGRILPRVRELWNTYGPTEATVASIQHRVRPHEPGPVPIGLPMPGERAYVVDSALRLVPPGAVGELLLGGAGVTRGYRGRADLTGAAFVDDPFTPGGRCYRTGDLVRRRPDGTLEFHGRRDHQVKVRGYRIELGEIEAVLREVADGTVAVAGADAQAHLVGYLAPETADPAAAERHLRSRLPGHMVPRRWVTLPALPTLPNGKVDRRALPDPADDPGAGRVAPGTDPERLVAAVWSAVLERSPIWADDDFFALGGHSFAATRVVGRLRETLLVTVPVRLLFERPVLADFAAALEELIFAELTNGSDA
ncbi:non-ribosomal peptide synthetase [Planomonospora sp. ID82291]|uniref:non-ribosomal peptide synthetase n=1 Tax=Planomonospora sp. ID82291 TaxID=2738136 RepID=UPI0018C411A0|nr:non-ribosomal peptide synthetase [Planomonospora sp. ID82291]MBG0814337.1 amino acid adenylation domain-containing protein [Planomonospora sp. ID82291]